MSDENPFSMHRESSFDQPARRSSNWKLIVFSVFAVTLFLCGGLLTVGYFAVQKIGGPATAIQLPPRTSDQFASDAAEFTASLKSMPNEAGGDVREFVRRSLDSSIDGTEIPFHTELFIEAMGQSELMDPPIGVVDRFQLRNWLKMYAPAPDPVEQHFRIAQVRIGPTPELATADLFYYSDEEQVESYQWFLANVDDQWFVYDWQRLEYGRRMSDEYAGYLRCLTSRSEGYDTAMVLAGEASELMQESDSDAARGKLLEAERTRMVDSDLPVARLRIAYTWMSIGEYDEAIRVLKTIKQPDRLWGVWPTMASCYYLNGDRELALESAKKAEKQSPGHPNVQWVLSLIYDETDDPERSANAAIAAARYCPADSGLVSGVLNHRRVKDVDTLVAAISTTQNESAWQRLVYSTTEDDPWSQAIKTAVENADGVPVGVSEIIAGNIASAADDPDAAASHYLNAIRKAQLTVWKDHAKSNHLWMRIERDQFGKLFEESLDKTATAQSLLENLYYGEFYGDDKKLLAAIQATPEIAEIPWCDGIVGWCFFESREFESAIESFDRLSKWMEANPDAVGESDWIIDENNYYVTQALLDSDQMPEALTRFADDETRIAQVATHVTESADDRLVDAFLQQTQDSKSIAKRMHRSRVLAKQAHRAGDHEACDRHYRQAIKDAQQFGPEMSQHWPVHLVQNRAIDMVRSGSPEAAIPIESLDLENADPVAEHFQSAVRESRRLQDVALTKRIVKEAAAAELDSDEALQQIRWTYAELLKSEGRFSDAIPIMKEVVSATSDENQWLRSHRNMTLIETLSKVRRLDEALECAKSHTTETASDVPADAIVALLFLDEPTLIKRLKSVSRSVANEWLDNHCSGTNSARTRIMVNLRREFPLYVGYQGTVLGEIFFPNDWIWSEGKLREFLPADSGETFRMQPLSPAESTTTRADVDAILATSQSGKRYLFTLRETTYQSELLPDEIRDRFSQPLKRLTIEVLDQEPKSAQRVFQFASSLATQDAIAFRWEYDTSLWFGDDLSEQLKWKNRIPISHAMRPLNLIIRPDEEAREDDEELLSIKDWKKRLDESDRPIEVQLKISTRHYVEKIPAEVVDADTSEYELHVRAKQSSKINPVIQRGFDYRCSWSQVE